MLTGTHTEMCGILREFYSVNKIFPSTFLMSEVKIHSGARKNKWDFGYLQKQYSTPRK